MRGGLNAQGLRALNDVAAALHEVEQALGKVEAAEMPRDNEDRRSGSGWFRLPNWMRWRDRAARADAQRPAGQGKDTE